MVQAHKKLDLWNLPEILVIHLKRFSYSHRFRDKIDALVNFPLEGLDLSQAMLREQVALHTHNATKLLPILIASKREEVSS